MAGEGKAGVHSSGRSLRAVVAVVDDAAVATISKVITEMGYDSVLLRDSGDALAALRDSPTDLVLVDDGAHSLGALAFVRLAQPLLEAAKTPVIVIGNGDNAGAAEEESDHVARVLLGQPFNEGDLREAVATAQWVRDSSLTARLGSHPSRPDERIRGARTASAGVAAYERTDDDAKTEGYVRAAPRGARTASSGHATGDEGETTVPHGGRRTAPSGQATDAGDDQGGGGGASSDGKAGKKRFKSTLSFSPQRVRTISTASTIAEAAGGGGGGDSGDSGDGAAEAVAAAASTAQAPAPGAASDAVARAEDLIPTVFHGRGSSQVEDLRRLVEAKRAEQAGAEQAGAEPPSESRPPSQPSLRPQPRRTQRSTAMKPTLSGARPADASTDNPPVRQSSAPRNKALRASGMPDGAVIADRYELRGLLGSGGMAVVYRAHDRELDEDVALKLLKVDKDDEESLTRFRHELRICRRLLHPAIVQTFEFGVYEGRRFLTMELLDGTDLDRLLKKRGKGLEIVEAVELFAQAARGLEAAHIAGILHRDIKPHNLFVLADGRRLKIMDFGIAKSVDMSHTMTAAAHVLGTPAYLAPERLRDQVELSVTTDLYSLGVVMYQALTLKLPFTGPDIPTLLTSILMDTPRPARALRPELPQALDRIIMRTLEREPTRRQPSCGVLAEELEDLAKSLRRAWA